MKVEDGQKMSEPNSMTHTHTTHHTLVAGVILPTFIQINKKPEYSV